MSTAASLDELIVAGRAFLKDVFRHLQENGETGSDLFASGRRFEKAIIGAATGRRPSYGTPRAQRKANQDARDLQAGSPAPTELPRPTGPTRPLTEGKEPSAEC